MAQQNRTTLKSYFESGDVPTEAQFADLIDSAYNPTEDGAPFSGAWADLTGRPATFPPSAHSHVIGDVTGLQTALDARAPLSHGHAIADVTGLQAALDARALASHTHPLSALTQSGATTGQVPVWNGTAWAPADQSGGGGGSFDIANMAATWNAAGTTFSAIRMNVTDTASAAGSMLLDLRVGGAKRAEIAKTGALSIYNTWTDDANFERGFFRWDTNSLRIGAERAGTGVAREVWLSGTALSFRSETNAEFGFFTTGQSRVVSGGADTRWASGNFIAQGSTTGLGNSTHAWRHLYMAEQATPPPVPNADRGVLYLEDNGSGKTRLMVRFATGAAQQIAIEP